MTRNRWLGWTAAAFLVLTLLTVTAGVFWLRSNSFRHYVIAKIIQQADEATGGRLEVQNIDFRWSTLTVNLYGITLHGTESPAERPLAQVDRLTVSLRMDSLLHRELRLTELLIEHPVAHLAIDKNGKSNLPEPAPQPGESHSRAFSIWRFATRRSTTGRSTGMTPEFRWPVAIRDLRTAVQFDLLRSGYTGTLSYENGEVQYGQYAPFPHRLSFEFTATPSSVSLEPLALAVRSSTISLRAKVTNYSQPKLDGTYDIHIHAEDFNSLSPDVKAGGEVQLSGAIRFATPSAGATIQGLSARRPARERSSSGRLASGKARDAACGGELPTCRGAARSPCPGRRPVAWPPERPYDGSTSGHNPAGRSVGLGRRHCARGFATGAPQSFLQTLAAHGSARGENSSFLDRESRKPARWPRLSPYGELFGARPTEWSGCSRRRERRMWFMTAEKTPSPFARLRSRRLATSLVVEGQLSDHSNLKIHASASDLGQVALLASVFSAPGSQAPVKVSGSANLDAVVEGSIDSPRLRGEGSAQNLETAGSQWKSAKFAFDANPSRFDLESASLVSGHQGDVAGNVQIGLKHWSYAPSNPLAAHLSIRKMSVADLEHLAGTELPHHRNPGRRYFTQRLATESGGQGTADWSGGQVWGEPVEALAVKFEAGNGSVHTTLKASLPAGNAQADLHYTPKTKTYSFDLEAPAIVLEKLQTVEAKNLELRGTVKARAHGEGTLDNPNVTASVELPSLRAPADLDHGNQSPIECCGSSRESAARFRGRPSPRRGAGHGEPHARL